MHMNSALRAATKLRIELPKSSLHARGREIGLRAYLLIYFKVVVYCSFRTFFRRRPRTQKAAKLFACLISWLGACLQVRCPVWRLQLTKEHNTRTPHKRAKHTHATQKEMYGYAREKNMKEAIRDGGGALHAPPLHLYCCCDISRVCIHASLFVWRACVSLCVARVCCALLCGARVLCSFVSCKRQTCRQAPSQEIRQASRPSDWGGILEKKYLYFGGFFETKKVAYI